MPMDQQDDHNIIAMHPDPNTPIPNKLLYEIKIQASTDNKMVNLNSLTDLESK